MNQLNTMHSRSQKVDLAEVEIARGNYSLAEAILLSHIHNGASDYQTWSLMAQVSSALLKHGQAVFSAYKANEISGSSNMRTIFADSLPFINFVAHDLELQNALARAIREGWGSPEVLNSYACQLLKFDPSFVSLEKIIDKDIRSENTQILNQAEFYNLSKNVLLLNALISAPLCDVQLEYFVTSVRKALLLGRDTKQFEEFVSAIAQQCFINEYIFSTTDLEANELLKIKQQSLVTGTYNLLLFACYEPIGGLGRISFVNSDKFTGPILKMQVDEPDIERRLGSEIESFSNVVDHTSIKVREMYEDSPYPRWSTIGPSRPAQFFIDHIKQSFPAAVINSNNDSKQKQMLVAGGGTGRHPIQIAQSYLNVDIDVIDLSIKSLAYAKRKSLELHINNIHYYQLDILDCELLKKQYDVIESVGVLHHMANPWAAWKLLLKKLKKDGFMKLGLYSSSARSDINAVRNFIAENNYYLTPLEVRNHRRKIIDYAVDNGLHDVLRMGDFYTTSSCRDLLFHIQETQVTISEISEFLAANGLNFLGFEIGPATRALYEQTYPEDKLLNNLENWSAFEQSYPKIFLGMYQFWVQKI